MHRNARNPVALAGLSAGISQGVGPGGIFGKAGAFSGVGDATVAAGLRGAASSALTQGVGVVTGLQPKFDWAGVAAAGIGAGAGASLGGITGFASLGKLGDRFAVSMAGGIADAASRSVINGSDFGDNLIAALPDVIGQTIGGMIADDVVGSGAPKRPPSNQLAAADTGDPGVRSDSPTVVQQAEAEIVVIGTRLKNGATQAGHSFLDWIDGWAGTNLGGHHPHERSSQPINVTFGLSNFFRPSSRSEITRAIRNGPTGGLFNSSQPATVRGWVFQQRLADNVSGFVNSNFGPGSAFDRGAGFLNQSLFGPGTPLGTLNNGFYSVVDGIAQSPLGDPGFIMSIEQSSPYGALPGGALSGIRSLSALRAETNAATFGLAASNDYRATFFSAYPELEGQVVVHHAVEQQVLTRYPGAVSEAEMHSLENLRGIPNELNSDLHLSQIRRDWNQFYRQNPNPTQQQLLIKATEIDNMYGSQFLPPR